MFSLEMTFKVADNSGVKYVKCFGVSSDYKNKSIKRGVLITVYPQAFSKRKVKKVIKKKYFGLIITLRTRIRRFNGVYTRGFKNKIFLLAESYKFIGTRTYGYICKEIRGGKNETLFKKIISYSLATV